jgi:hypothetical protein
MSDPTPEQCLAWAHEAGINPARRYNIASPYSIERFAVLAYAAGKDEAADEIDRLREQLREIRRAVGTLHDLAFPHMAGAVPPTLAASSKRLDK